MAATLVLWLAAVCLAAAAALTIYGLTQIGSGRRRAGAHALTSAVVAEPMSATAASSVVSPPPTSVQQRWVHLEGQTPLVAEPGVLLNTLWEHLQTAECQQGECGGCRLRLIEGDVRWIRDPQIEIDRRTHILACSCEPLGTVKCALP